MSEKIDFSVKAHESSNIRKVIGIVSGKGGVGKSLVTSLLAVKMNNKGYSTAILDGDITGPSIPKAFGIKDKLTANESGWLPIKSSKGISIISTNFLLPDDSDPVVWRAPVVTRLIKQFWGDVIWGNVDFMFVDMPPGTGDVPLTVFQSLPVDGIIVVTSPQELVSIIVEKAVKMAKMMNIPIVGLVENMSYINCPDCNKEIKVFGESHIDEIAEKHNLDILARIPIVAEITKSIDNGVIEEYDSDWLDDAADIIEKI